MPSKAICHILNALNLSFKTFELNAQELDLSF